MKRRFLFMLLVSMLLLLLSSGLAEAKNGGDGVVTSISFDYLSKAQSSILVNTNNTISVKGETRAYTNVEKIAVTVYLEKKNGSNWTVVKSWYNCNYDDSNVISIGTSGTLSSGTYRVRSYHRIDTDGIIETTDSYTNQQTI
ncbi:DUF6147 family protein [Pelotomaculum terephthalicicum JT]|uniref:DUF6147 family protein n=1 Tax=Pelotomaculum TaxID=191373 RepID=UPI0009CA4829|nr:MULTISPECIES: DUF6147 family protein [Pelotomaculum]MCG9969780.1 DUF6147 family protein [Pelotomaculum terephthalicicum JT]OPX84786.1 MAG: hypothetical protein A4E54_02779 [Pelotomaculum sp. PtaB.Bin117]OPY62153.1 MAG: hypothetical protein A4E56_01498 [Pelotomaculum sp. PtaU1.Bin065]